MYVLYNLVNVGVACFVKEIQSLQINFFCCFIYRPRVINFYIRIAEKTKTKMREHRRYNRSLEYVYT